jgi:histidinol-phosphate/aromatic aminotransferase/cobyric acid decarboxylase-like protein
MMLHLLRTRARLGVRPLAAALSGAAPTGASRRSEGMASFKVMEVLTKANSLQASGVDVLHMEVGQPATPAPPAARAAAEAALGRDEAMGYTNPNGLPDVQARIARWYAERHGADVDPARVVVTTGSSAGFILSFMALFDAGDKVGVPSTAYPCYRNLLRTFGCEPVPLAGDAADPRSGFAFPTPADVAIAARDGVRGLILSSPSNPTGAALRADELAALATACAANDVRFISDEIYHHIVYGDEPSPSAVDLPGALVVNSFSKYFSMTGWRIGWLVLPEGDAALAGAVERLQQNLFINAPTARLPGFFFFAATRPRKFRRRCPRSPPAPRSTTRLARSRTTSRATSGTARSASTPTTSRRPRARSMSTSTSAPSASRTRRTSAAASSRTRASPSRPASTSSSTRPSASAASASPTAATRTPSRARWTG